VIFALTEVLGLEKFGEADYLRAASGGIGGAFESLLKILLGVGAARHLHQGHAEFVRGHASSSADQYSIRKAAASFQHELAFLRNRAIIRPLWRGSLLARG
jgi:hypothetical protein